MFRRRDPEVLVVGAGPVGLLTALVLKDRGVEVDVVDRDRRISVRSYALALHPGTLTLLDELGLANAIVPLGRMVRKVGFYAGGSRKAEIDFAGAGGRHPYVLVVQQSLLERTLEDELRKRKIKVLWNHRLEALKDGGDAPEAEIAKLDQITTGYPIARTEWEVMRTFPSRPQFVVGADGYDSTVRRLAGIRMSEAGKTDVYAVFEIEAEGSMPEEARFDLDAGATNVYWPMEEDRCRFSFELSSETPFEANPETLRALLAERAPWFTARPTGSFWTTTARFERKLVDAFGRGRVWLAGDAAHLASPLGAQSMNVGLREGHDLAGHLAEVIRHGAPVTSLEAYGTARRAEWAALLGGDKAVVSNPGAGDWVKANAARIVTSIPASGPELKALLAQIGIGTAQGV
jgi:2-polyprenyl-6-methoxyphenol hydroxylase-like FAD-dependent oxidoreductase